LSASIFPRLADVISDTDKGKRSLRARKFASGKLALRICVVSRLPVQYKANITAQNRTQNFYTYDLHAVHLTHAAENI
jgi:hypothetical protein